jgi:NitT/TauT family transport system permease protein
MRNALSTLLPVLVFGLLMGGLELGLRLFHVPTYFFPYPSGVLEAFLDQPGRFLEALFDTAVSAGTGLCLSAVFGVLIALLLSLHPWIRKAFYPYAVFFQTVPIIAIAPMLVVWFGYGRNAIVASAFIVSVFPMIANCLTGLLSSDRLLLDLFRLYGAPHLAVLMKLRIPTALPFFLTGLRIASGLSVIGALVGEFVADTLNDGGGIGTLIEVSIKEQRSDQVFAAVLLASLLGLLFFGTVTAVSALTRRAFHIGETRET